MRRTQRTCGMCGDKPVAFASKLGICLECREVRRRTSRLTRDQRYRKERKEAEAVDDAELSRIIDAALAAGDRRRWRERWRSDRGW